MLMKALKALFAEKKASEQDLPILGKKMEFGRR